MPSEQSRPLATLVPPEHTKQLSLMRLQGWEVSSGKRHAPDLNATEVVDLAVPCKVRKTIHQWCKFLPCMVVPRDQASGQLLVLKVLIA